MQHRTIARWISCALGLAVFTTAAQGAPSQLPSCIVQESTRYDWARDARVTSRGNEGYSSYARRNDRKNCRKPWTVLVYMAADNDLAPYAYWDLYEMEAGFGGGRQLGGATERSDVLVQLDTPGDTGLRRLHIQQTRDVYRPSLGLEHFKAKRETDIQSPIVRLMKEDRSGEATRLLRFLEWGIAEYPAERYMVIVWGHGQGWTAATAASATSRYLDRSDVDLGVPAPPAPGVTTPRQWGGIGFNSSSGRYLDIPSLRRVLEIVSRKRLGGRPIDVYASDACLMQMAEVALELASVTRYIVGSTQVQNFLGLPYRRVLYELNTGRFGGERSATQGAGDEAYWLARMMPKVFKSSMQPGGAQGRHARGGIETVTMSALSSDELRYQLWPAMDALGRAGVEYLGEDPMRAMDIEFVFQSAPSFQGGAQDIGSFLTLMKLLIRTEGEANGGLTRTAQKLDRALDDARAALNRTVLAYALGTRYTGAEDQMHLLGFRAFSTWLPVSPEDYQARIQDFRASRYFRADGVTGGWDLFLDTLY